MSIVGVEPFICAFRNGMTRESCHFLIHQYTKLKKANEIINNVNALAAVAAAFVRRFDVSRLDKLDNIKHDTGAETKSPATSRRSV